MIIKFTGSTLKGILVDYGEDELAATVDGLEDGVLDRIGEAAMDHAIDGKTIHLSILMAATHVLADREPKRKRRKKKT